MGVGVGELVGVGEGLVLPDVMVIAAVLSVPQSTRSVPVKRSTMLVSLVAPEVQTKLKLAVPAASALTVMVAMLVAPL